MLADVSYISMTSFRKLMEMQNVEIQVYEYRLFTGADKFKISFKFCVSY